MSQNLDNAAEIIFSMMFSSVILVVWHSYYLWLQELPENTFF